MLQYILISNTEDNTEHSSSIATAFPLDAIHYIERQVSPVLSTHYLPDADFSVGISRFIIPAAGDSQVRKSRQYDGCRMRSTQLETVRTELENLTEGVA